MRHNTTGDANRTWTHLISLINRFARKAADQWELDADELASNTILALTLHVRRNPGWLTDQTDKTGYINAVVCRQAGRQRREPGRPRLVTKPDQFFPVTDRQHMWNAVADTFDTEPVNPESVSEFVAARIRKTVAAAGIHHILNQWENGTITADEKYALFNPWGKARRPATFVTFNNWCPPSHDVQASIVRALRTSGHLAGDMWNLAVREATRYDSRKSRPTQRQSGSLAA